MCQANPPPGSNPAGRGAGNTYGSTGAVTDPNARGAGNTIGGMPNDPSASSANVGSTPHADVTNGSLYDWARPGGATRLPDSSAPTNQSFQQQGFAGVGTVNPATPGTTGIVAPRMMDTGPLFGTAATPTSVAGMASSALGSAPSSVANMTSSAYGNLSNQMSGNASAGAPFPEATQQTDPYILRDQMYGINPTPVNSVTNALMRRYRY